MLTYADTHTYKPARCSTAAASGADGRAAGAGADADFIASPNFAGPKPGMVYKKDSKGLGYYKDELAKDSATAKLSLAVKPQTSRQTQRPLQADSQPSSSSEGAAKGASGVREQPSSSSSSRSIFNPPPQRSIFNPTPAAATQAISQQITQATSQQIPLHGVMGQMLIGGYKVGDRYLLCRSLSVSMRPSVRLSVRVCAACAVCVCVWLGGCACVCVWVCVCAGVSGRATGGL